MHTLDARRAQLRTSLDLHRPPPVEPVSIVDPHLLASCVQKALRRHDRRYVLAASQALLRCDPDRFWRRLVVAVFEDFGRADLELTAAVVAAASNKHWRQKVGGDWHVASYLLERLLIAPCDRFLDELVTFIDAVRKFPAVLAESCRSSPSPDLSGLVQTAFGLVSSCEAPIPRREGYSPLPGACDRALQSMCDAGLLDLELREVCAQGRRTSQCVLPVVLPTVLDTIRRVGDRRELETPVLPPVCEIGGLPGYAFDGYTRPGRVALAELLEQHLQLRRLLLARGAMSNPVSGLQVLVFDVEGGVASRGLTHPLLEELKTYSVGCAGGLVGPVRHEALAMVREAIPVLNALRAEFQSNEPTRPQ